MVRARASASSASRWARPGSPAWAVAAARSASAPAWTLGSVMVRATAGPYRPRITRFDNPFAAAPFPADALPFGGHWGGRQKPDTRAGGLVGPPGRTDPSTGRLTSCLAADDCWPSPPDGYGNGALANSARDQA
jgi:hypothetical protein